MADLFDGYALGGQWDEMFGGPSLPRAAVRRAVRRSCSRWRPRSSPPAPTCSARPTATPASPSRTPARSSRSRSTSCRASSAPRSGTLIERGVVQRVHALEAFLADVYGAGQVFADRIVPRSVVTTSAHFHRQAHGLVPPNGVRIHVAGVDLVRDEAGDFRVLEDNLRSPSGVSYVITNRAAMSQVLPELFADHRIQPVADYPSRLLAALKASAPANVADPTVVVLTPGVYNSAYFEHALLARQMGVELVEGRDLVCTGNQVSMRTTDGQQPRRRHLPPDRRRVPRPGALPAGLGHRLRRRAQRRPRRPGHDRQRGRQRRRRRQAALHLGARPHPLLPGRGAGAGRTPRPTGWTSRTPSSGCWSPSTSWCSSRSTAPAARAS